MGLIGYKAESEALFQICVDVLQEGLDSLLDDAGDK